MTESEFTWEEALEIADKLAFENTGSHLKDIETIVLEASKIPVIVLSISIKM
jgi:hypothetical protein